MTAISPLLSGQANQAAQLHIDGQPGTFLTTLGSDVLTVLYQTLPNSDHGFGFAAIDKIDERKELVGFVSATTGIGGLFLELGTHNFIKFLLPLVNRYTQKPTLIFHTVQALFYPLMVQSNGTDNAIPTAELLSIMVKPERRGQRIGSQLIDELTSSCFERGMKLLDVTVDTENHGATRFYEHHGFAFHKKLTLNGQRNVSVSTNTTGSPPWLTIPSLQSSAIPIG